MIKISPTNNRSSAPRCGQSFPSKSFELPILSASWIAPVSRANEIQKEPSRSYFSIKQLHLCSEIAYKLHRVMLFTLELDKHTWQQSGILKDLKLQINSICGGLCSVYRCLGSLWVHYWSGICIPTRRCPPFFPLRAYATDWRWQSKFI